MLWVALLISLILLYLFRKQVSVIVGIVALMVAVVLLYIYNEEKTHERERASITINVKYDDVVCSPDKPLHVVIKNTSSRIAQDVKWNIEVFRFGYSSNIVKGAGGGDPWSTPYRVDAPLKVVEQIIICYSVPALNGKYELSQLLYRITNKKVELL